MGDAKVTDKLTYGNVTINLESRHDGPWSVLYLLNTDKLRVFRNRTVNPSLGTYPLIYHSGPQVFKYYSKKIRGRSNTRGSFKKSRDLEIKNQQVGLSNSKSMGVKTYVNVNMDTDPNHRPPGVFFLLIFELR